MAQHLHTSRDRLIMGLGGGGAGAQKVVKGTLSGEEHAFRSGWFAQISLIDGISPPNGELLFQS